jgi:hypothetical protein
MSINLGSNKIGKINVGSSSIGKVYKGSELVYQSQKSLYCYSFGGSITTANDGTQLVVSSYLVGSKDTSGTVLFIASPGPIYKTQGVLGTSGSQICISLQDNYSWDKYVPYKSTLVINGVSVYVFYQKGGGFMDSPSYLVLEGATTQYFQNFAGEQGIDHPVSVSDEGIVAYSGANQVAWTPQYDKIWTVNGIFDA